MIRVMSVWSDRRVWGIALAVAGLFALGPLALLGAGGQETWLLLAMLATVPFVFMAVPVWLRVWKRDKDDQARQWMIVETTAWPSLIALWIGIALMGVAAGLKIGGTPVALVGGTVAAMLFSLCIYSERTLHHLMVARLNGESIEPAKASLGRWALSLLAFVGQFCLTAAFGYALGGVAGAVALTLSTALVTGGAMAFGVHKRRKIQAQRRA
jgi:hypothetical protein